MKSFRILFFGATLLLMVGCSGKHDDNRLSTARAEARQRAETVMSDVDRAMDKMRTQLASASAEAKDSLQSKLDKLQDARNDLSEKLNKLNATTANEWQDFRKDMNEKIRDVEKTLHER